MKYLAEKDLKRIKEEEEEEERRYKERMEKEKEDKEKDERPPVKRPPVEGPAPPPGPPPGFSQSSVRIGEATNPDDDELNEEVQWALWDAPWREARRRQERRRGWYDDEEEEDDRERSPRRINALTLATVEHEEKITVAFDTGAAVTTIPEALAKDVRDDGNDQKYRTASGELIVDKGSTCLLGQDERYNNKAIRGRVTEVRKTLASGSAVCKHNMVVLNGNGGEIIPSGSNIAKHLEKELEKAKKWYPNEAVTSTPLRVEKGVYVFDFWRNKEAKDLNAVGDEEDVAADSAAASDPFKRQAKKL